MKNIQRDARLFQAFANSSRLKILIALRREGELSVSELATRIHVTFKGTSQHLRILIDRNILERDGRAGHVFYRIREDLDADMRKLLELATKS